MHSHTGSVRESRISILEGVRELFVKLLSITIFKIYMEIHYRHQIGATLIMPAGAESRYRKNVLTD